MPLSGLLFAVLFGLGSGLWVFDQPSRGAESGEVVRFFEGASTEILVGGTISLVSIVFLVLFGVTLREHLRTAAGRGPNGMALLAFAGTILLAAVGFAAETINMAGALSARDGQLTRDSAQIYFDLSYAFGAHAASIAIGMVALAVGVIALTTGRPVPGWAAWFAVLFGVAMLTPAILNRVAFLILYSVTVLSFAALSLRLYRDGHREVAGASANVT